MSDFENTMGLEINPYDSLIKQADEPVISPVDLSKMSVPETGAGTMKSVEIIPLAGSAKYIKVSTKEMAVGEVIEFTVEEELLVPDTEPDMEMILNLDAAVFEENIHIGEERNKIGGKIRLEIIYKSYETYGNNINTIETYIDFERQLTNENTEVQQRLHLEIKNTEYRIINERKYKVKLYITAVVEEEQERDRLLFDGIEGEHLYVRREKVKFENLISCKTTDGTVSEQMMINDEKVRPVRILKSKFTVTENHNQMTKEKIMINQTIWVRILYLAELANKGNLSNQPMLFQGKIDHTRFVPVSKDEQDAVHCIIRAAEENLTAEINRESNGFDISGDIRNEIKLYGSIEKDIVLDFYHDKEEMTCDRKTDKICSGVTILPVEYSIRESIDLQQNSGDEYRIIYMDAAVVESSVERTAEGVAVRGRIQLEAVTMNEEDYTVLAKKLCDFICVKELDNSTGIRPELAGIELKEMDAQIIMSNQINVTAQLQVQLHIYNEAEISCITNPCYIRSGETASVYPLTVYTVKEGESSWDIGKKFRTSEQAIVDLNKAENIRPGKKIIIVK